MILMIMAQKIDQPFLSDLIAKMTSFLYLQRTETLESQDLIRSTQTMSIKMALRTGQLSV